jgi:hypothetical protein
MALTCDCPLPSVLPNVGNAECKFDFDQIIRIGFQLPQDSPSFDSPSDIEDLAEWQVLTSAADSTKIVLSPLVQMVVIPGSEGAFEGGDDNSTVDGLPLYKGENTVTIEGMLYSIPPTILKKLRELSCFSVSQLGATKLTAYLFTGTNQVVSMEDLSGIPINNFRVGSTGSEGFREFNKTGFSFNVKGDWDSYITMTKLDFDPRSLVNSGS